ncbi:MAG: T9SS type A sorting domain-containing protein, partial [Flavobacteriales bacterium]|nr:T9SS type A sorting domain-containing protein [Flavobacteriales bacterium]
LALPPAIISNSTPLTFCNGESVVLMANTGIGMNYEWELDATSIVGSDADLTVLTDGSYTVEVTDANGCTTLSDATIVSVLPLPDASVTNTQPTTVCQGETVVISGIQNANNSYQWFDDALLLTGEDGFELTALASGEYHVNVVAQNGCELGSDTIDVTVFDLPTVDVTSDGVLTFCDGDSVTFEADAPTATSYQWQESESDISGENTSELTALQTGDYTIEVEDANGCISISDAISVTVLALPDASVTNTQPTTVCQGETVVISGIQNANNSYQWFDDALLLTGEDVFELTALASGEYHVNVVAQNGCELGSDTVDVTVLDLPTVDVTSNGFLAFCDGDSVTLSADAPTATSYQWQESEIDISGENTAELTVYESGDYVVVINDGNCSNTGQLMTATVYDLPIVEIGNDTLICTGDSILLEVATGYSSYLWSTSDDTEEIYVSNADTYSVIVTDANNCENFDTLTLGLNPLPTPITIVGNPLVGGFSVENYSVAGNGSSTYTWIVDGGNVVSGQGTNFAGIQWGGSGSGLIQVFETNEFSCDGDTAEMEINILITGIRNSVGGNDLTFYPNPTNEFIYTKFTGTQAITLSIELLDSRGRLVYSTTEHSGNVAPISVSNYAAGLYFIHARSEDRNWVQKIEIR